MCGIAGAVRWSRGEAPSEAEMRRMLAVLRHRGPDEFGTYVDGVAGLAHARLSIIDLSTGQQPLANEDETLWIVFNGEIFNYVELRAELVALGHRFRTASDTEVIVHAFEAWGEGCVERFNGQFAFALWDARSRRLFLARDRLGVRPLYYTVAADRFLFASEIKAIFTDPAVPRSIDPVGVDQVFTFWTTVSPVTPFAGIRELSAAHTLTVDFAAGTPGPIASRPYWTPSYAAKGAPRSMTLPEAAEGLREKLETATRLRMLRADVPVGSYLSGGIDSSVVAAMGRRAREGVFRTFSLRFADQEFDETEYQRLMVRRLESEHTEVVCDRRDIGLIFPDIISHTERPILRTGPAPMYLLSRLVRDAGFKVVLTGEGSDEMLAGYDIFREAKVRAFWARQPGSAIRPRLLERLYPYLARSPVAAKAIARKFFGQGLDSAGRPGFSHRPRWSSVAALKRLFSTPLQSALANRDAEADLLADLPPEFPSWDLVSQAQYLEARTLLSGYILSSQGDRMLMANSVEGRFPFLDPDVVAYCNALPSVDKLHVLDEKHVLKRAVADLVPVEILERPKQPYRAPDAPSFLGDGAPAYVDEVLAPARVAEAGLFDPAGVSALLAKCRGARGPAPLSNADNMAFVGVLSTQLLWEMFVESRPAGPELGEDQIKTRVNRSAAGSSEPRSLRGAR
jgi:asparagine synthase (glutamine-hydrolysing)